MFTDAESQEIVNHMNSDHSDAVLLYARVYANCPEAHTAVMTAISDVAMEIDVSSINCRERRVIQFDEVLQSSQDARRVLIKMARHAREVVGSGEC